MAHRLNIKDWTLKPFEQFGPLPLVDLTREVLEKTFGPPQKDLTKKGMGYLVYHTADDELVAWVNDDQMINNLLVSCKSFKIQRPTQTLTLPGKKEKMPSFLFEHDPLTRVREEKKDELFCPLFGLLWDDAKGFVAVYAAIQKIHLLLAENYWSSSLEYLGDEAFMQKLTKLRGQHPDLFKTSWTPVILESDVGESFWPHCHYGGLPLLKQGEKHPTCQICGQTLALNIQMDLGFMPAVLQKKFGSHGYFQMFICQEEKCITQYSDPSDLPGTVSLARWIPDLNLAESKNTQAKILPQFDIIDWVAEMDGPRPSVLEKALGKPLEKIFKSEDDSETYFGYFPVTTDKWGEEPNWVQDEDLTPDCPVCKSKMDFVFQYRADEDKEFYFGDAGLVHFFRCPKHGEEVRLVLEF